MGNDSSRSIKTKKDASFKQELLKIFPNTKDVDLITKEDLLKIFPDRPLLCSKVIDWAKSFQIVKKQKILLCLELLLLDSDCISFEDYSNHSYNPLEIFLSLICSQSLGSVQEIINSKIQEFLTILFEVFLGSSKNPAEHVTPLFLTIKNKIGTENIHSRRFTQIFADILPYAGLYLKSQLHGLFKNQPIFTPPDLSKGEVMNLQTYLLLGLSTNKLIGQKADLLYSMKLNGTSFNRLSYAIKGFNAPIFILIRESHDTIDGKKTGIFGGYCNCMIDDTVSYFGNNETFLFSLFPKFSTYFTYNAKGGTNYIYLNTRRVQGSNFKPGFGFGGDEEYRRFGIWIDAEISEGSYSSEKTSTFGNDYLTDSTDTHLNITGIEIWGVPKYDTYQKQENYRNMQDQMTQNNRKIDRNEFFGGQKMRDLLIDKPNVRDQMHIDLDTEKAAMEKQ